MGRLVVFMNVTLDGVMQAPGRPDEDTRGGFAHGGWGAPYADPVAMRAAAESMDQTGTLLFGRRTYQDFYSVWPKRTANPFTPVLNNTQKYVASTTLREPLPWANSTLLKGETASAVAQLRAKSRKDIVILGSGELVRSLMRDGVIDVYVLQIHPLILGSGRRLFEDSGRCVSLQLVDSRTTTTGVVIATYRPIDAHPTVGA